LVLGSIAVVLSLTGSAVAGSLITGSDIKNGTITAKDIKSGTITGKDIKKGTITTSRLSESTRSALAGKEGPAGPMGATGAQGAQGLQGERGPSVLGSAGSKGDKGDKGDTGDQGPQGETGATGTKGDKGDPGEKGEKGDTGAQGPKGDNGEKGDKGDKGDNGEKGDKGDKGDPGPVFSSGNWGVINRNTIGSPQAVLRSGPFDAPVGDGSLNFNVGSPAEKATYGNEMDFVGDSVDALAAVGFHVYTTGENNARYTANMPSITFEIDPNMADRTTNYSSLVFTPTANSAANQWSGYIDATTSGLWGLTGGQFAGDTCSLNGSRCTFAQLKDFLDDEDGNPAQILTVAVTKGRDYEWSGAVDGLRINGTVFDFEETGVFERAA
jgi:hypothetical protein